MKRIVLTPRQRSSLVFAIKVMADNSDLSQFTKKLIKEIKDDFEIWDDGDVVANLINIIFSKVQYAWHTPGFPFADLNGIYKDISGGEDHPVFKDLFGNSFESGSEIGTYEENREKAGEAAGSFWAKMIKYYQIKPGFLQGVQV